MKIVVAGSKRFAEMQREWAKRLTEAAHMVYCLASLGPDHDAVAVDLLQRQAIADADAIFVVNGPHEGVAYIGADTARDIAWAKLLGKDVFWYSNGAGQRLTADIPATYLPLHGDMLIQIAANARAEEAARAAGPAMTRPAEDEPVGLVDFSSLDPALQAMADNHAAGVAAKALLRGDLQTGDLAEGQDAGEPEDPLSETAMVDLQLGAAP